MKHSSVRRFDKLAVIGAGNMGSGIAQKMATEGFPVVLVDLDDEKVERGLGIIRQTLAEGVERKLFRPEQADEIAGRISGTSNWKDLCDVDLVVEAVFEDLGVKQSVFERLDGVCREDAILGTNTSSFSVTELAAILAIPEGTVKSRLHRGRALLKEAIGKLPATREEQESVRVLLGDWAEKMQDQIKDAT